MSISFSIIIPCYNQAHFLADCLDSLLQQTYMNWEAIVVNDGSLDNTNEVALIFVAKDSRIKLVEKQNGGLSSARNYGMQYAVGERFIFLDADDFLYPNCIEKISLAIVTVDDNCLIRCGYSYISEDKNKILSDVKNSQSKDPFPAIFEGNLGPCHSICISKKLAKNIGAFDETLKSVEDWDYWMRAIKAGASIKIIPDSLVYYRYAKGSMSRNPFVLYDALKTVISRGPKKDERIVIESPFNKDYDFDTSRVLQNVLIRSLGVGVMQGNISETLAFFKTETSKPLIDYKPEEFETMCSYLSFRYWYSRSDITEVFTKIYPNFVNFFKEAGYNTLFTRKALFSIFKRHLFYKNKYVYGKAIGGLFNIVMRNKNKYF